MLGCGWYVDILHAGNVITRYCHMVSRPIVRVGQYVGAGEVIGLSGSSGNSSGPHLHFEVHLNGDSSNAGAVDPVPFMNQVGAPLVGSVMSRSRTRLFRHQRALFLRLRGRRVIVGVPGIGFRGDLRADDPVVQGGRTFVPVLTEQDYYRPELEQIEVFAPLVPIDRVWVEEVRPGVLGRDGATRRPPPAGPNPVGQTFVGVALDADGSFGSSPTGSSATCGGVRSPIRRRRAHHAFECVLKRSGTVGIPGPITASIEVSALEHGLSDPSLVRPQTRQPSSSSSSNRHRANVSAGQGPVPRQ